MLKVVCVVVLQGLLARAFSAASNVDGSAEPVMVEGVAKFSGIVPATGSVTVLGNFGCAPMRPPNPPIVGNAAPFIRRNEYLAPTNGYPWPSKVDIMYNAGPLSLPSNLPMVHKNAMESPIGSDTYSLFPRGANDFNIYNADPMLPVTYPSKEVFEYNKESGVYMDDLSKKLMMGSLIADSILTGKQAEIEDKLAEIDSIVNSELYKTNSIIDIIQEDSIIQVINTLLNSDLSEIESAIDKLEIIVESELEKVEQVVESMLENKTTIVELEQVVTELLINLGMGKLATKMTQEDIDEALAEMDEIIESDLAVIDSFIESELAKVDLFMEAELAKMESFVDAKQAIFQALIDAEVDNMNRNMNKELDEINAPVDFKSCFDSEPAIVNVPIPGVTQFGGRIPATGQVSLFGNTGYSPMFEKYQDIPAPQLAFYDEMYPATDYSNYEDFPDSVEGETRFSGKVPAVGRAQVFGGCRDSPMFERYQNIPEPRPAYANEMSPSTDYSNYEEFSDSTVGEMRFSGRVPAVGRAQVFGGCGGSPRFPSNPPTWYPGPYIQNEQFSLANRITNALVAKQRYNARNNYRSDGLSHINHLPTVNLNYNNRMDPVDEYPETMVEDTLEFNGRTLATGRATVFANFGCAPLLPTQEGPDGKKYICLFNRPNDNIIPPPPIRRGPVPPMPYPSDFAEAIMDGSRNYERYLEDEVFGQEYLDVPEFFRGRVPAFGSVSLSGRY